MKTDRTAAAPTSDEALEALERANTPPPPVVDPAVAERQRAALQVLEALIREHTWRAEVETWFSTKPLENVLKGLGMTLGEPLAEATRAVRLVDYAIHGGGEILRAPGLAKLERRATELRAATAPGVIGALVAEAERHAIAIRQARAAIPSWRRAVAAVEDEVRQMVTALQAWLADCERARGGA
jgi:hypothetical protein